MKDHKDKTSKSEEELTPETFTGIKVTAPKTTAAGWPALGSALKHAFTYMKPAQAVRTMFKVNQKGGFDCPGCAWPDPDDDRSALGEYCENGIKAIAEEASKKTIGSEFFSQNSVFELSQLSDFQLGKLGRLSEPMYLKAGGTHYEPISWNGAFELLGQKLNALEDPNEGVFYTSGRTSNEAAYLYQLFVRAFGTNNLPDCSNMCHESSGKGLSKTVGIGKGSVKLEDFYKTDLVIVIGQNPGTNHPRMLSALQKCKQNGGKIITINPLPEAGLLKFINPQSPAQMLGGGTMLTDLFLQVKINQDIPLLKAIMKRLLDDESAIDHDFIENNTSGYEEFKASLSSIDADACIEASGVDKKAVEQAISWISQYNKIIVCWAMGLTQHENGVANIQEVVNLLLMKGSIGKPGAGTCPVRGHSNVQGDRTVGIWEAPPESLLSSLDSRYKFTAPRAHGYAVVDAIKAMHEGKAKVFFAMGGNFLSATPDTSFTAEALRNCELTAHVSTKLNRSHLVHGKEALILPCLGRTEVDKTNAGPQFVTVENSMGVVHSSQGILSPCSDKLKSEVNIVSEVAKNTLKNDIGVNWAALSENYDLIRDEIEAVIPGFEKYNERVRRPGGFYLPNGARDGRYNTLDKKAQFTINEIPAHNLNSDELMMMTIRSHDQYNTTIYGLDDRYRGIHNERRVVLMNGKDIISRGLKAGDVVNLTSHYGQERLARKFIVVLYDIPKGCVATYFPEANTLVPHDYYAKESKTPASKSIVVKVLKST